MDELFFFSNSADKKAGKGTNEYVDAEEDYTELNKIKDWRKILSNLYCGEFMYDNKTWNSVEHAFQSKKIELVDKDQAYLFCKESGHEIGLGNGFIARKNRKLIILNKKQLITWNKIKHKIMYDILLEKFTQVPIAKQVLLLTRDAKLMHGARGISKSEQIELEAVRNVLVLNK